MSNTDDGVVECVSIDGKVIDLSDVSPGLRQQYRNACRAVGRHEKSRDELKRVGNSILAEQALKRAPAIRGDHAVTKRLSGLR